MGRPKDPGKMVTVSVRLPPSVVKRIDAERGETPRGEFVRAVVARRFDPPQVGQRSAGTVEIETYNTRPIVHAQRAGEDEGIRIEGAIASPSVVTDSTVQTAAPVVQLPRAGEVTTRFKK